MTVTYTADVATGKGFGTFLKLLARWRGSVYKLVWQDLLVFLLLYFALSYLYRVVLNEIHRSYFESLVIYCYEFGNLLPVSFVLGFYVTIVMERWWEQYISIPWPESLAVFVSSHLHGQDERARVMRRTIMRYVCLCLAMALTLVSPRVKKRFPTFQHFVDAGLMLENERKVIEDINSISPNYPKHWMPIVWASAIVTRARKEGRIRDDMSVKTIIDALNLFRGQCGLLTYYNAIGVPLVYTQVVTLGTYSYLLTQLIGQQWIEKQGDDVRLDSFFPYFTVLQFIFYMGWLKVAEVLINPFGDDDDDFEVNWMIDRNLQISYWIVDEMHHAHPELVKDQYWDEVFPSELPYQDGKRESPPATSTAGLDFTQLPRSSAKDKSRISESSDDILVAQKRKPDTVRIIDDKGEAASSIDQSGSKLLSLFELFRPRHTPTEQESDTSLLLRSDVGDNYLVRSDADDNYLVRSDADDNYLVKAKLSAISDMFERLKKDRQDDRTERMKNKLVRDMGHAADLNVVSTVKKEDEEEKTTENDETENGADVEEETAGQWKKMKKNQEEQQKKK